MKYFFVSILHLALLVAFSYAQIATGRLRGQVADPSGAVIPNARVTVTALDGTTRDAKSNATGNYEIGDLAPGKYTVSAHAQGFAIFVKDGVDVTPGSAQLNIALEITAEKETVNVQEGGAQVDVSPSNNASAIVLSGKDLEALPDDPDELQQDLQALAGPSAGPSGGQIYIDGFTTGQMPPKASIREIRINQNPFSAEFDKLGYGRIEVFTKPGTDKIHGQFSVEGNESAFNARNPFACAGPRTLPCANPPYYSTNFSGSLGGPLNKKASYFLDVQRRDVNEVAIVNATVLDSELNQIPFSTSVPNPRTRTNVGPRLDYQISKSNTLTARYQFFRDTQDNAGVGQFALASSGYNTDSTEHTLQVSDTQIIGTKVVNETRFQYIRANNQQTPVGIGPTINVTGAFTGGRSSAGTLDDRSDRYELQNYTSVALGAHFLKFGGRLRTEHETSASDAGFNGIFSFHSLDDYQAAEKLLAGGALKASGANQFKLNATPSGSIPTVSATVVDAGLYVQDEWKLRPTFTVSAGLRFETQNAIHDHADWAPRVAIAWGIAGKGKTPKTVLRAGYGLFYDRFAESSVLNTHLLNGVTQQQYVVTNNKTVIDFFPKVPPPDQLPASQTTPTIYQIAPMLHSPYILQSAVSVERQLTKNATVTMSYLNSRGVHQFLSWNANAPFPDTPFSNGPRPNPLAGNIFQYASEGIFKQNQFIANFNVRVGTKLTLFGFYSLSYVNSDISGAGSFPSNQYDLTADYGRASFDTRHRLFFGGSVGMPWGFRLSPFMIFNSGTPYNVSAGQDVNNDSLLNDRPALATNVSGACLSLTAACHYTVPTQAYAPIPVNYLTGPDRFTLNLRLAKTFGFGPEKGGPQRADGIGSPGGGGPGGFPGGGGPRGGGGFGRPGGFGNPTTNHRYNLTFSVTARNVLNNVNLATPIGDISSPQFGRSNGLAGGPFSGGASNRRIQLQAAFSF